MSYLVRVRRTARKQLERFSLKEIGFLDEVITSLGENPYPKSGLKLKGIDCYRIRVRDIRVIYSIDNREKIIWIERIARRHEDTYRGL